MTSNDKNFEHLTEGPTANNRRNDSEREKAHLAPTQVILGHLESSRAASWKQSYEISIQKSCQRKTTNL